MIFFKKKVVLLDDAKYGYIPQKTLCFTKIQHFTGIKFIMF